MVKDNNKNLTTKAPRTPRKTKQNIMFFLVNLGVLGGSHFLVEQALVFGEATVLHCFGNVLRLDGLAAGQIGDGTRHFQYAVIGAC